MKTGRQTGAERAEERRTFVRERLLDGWTHAEIARALGVHRTTATYYADLTNRRKTKRVAA